MKIVQDDDRQTIVEGSTLGIWLTAGLLGVGTVAGVWLTATLTGIFDSAWLLFTLAVPLIIAPSPSVRLHFEHASRAVRVRLTWLFFSMNKVFPYSALAGFDLAQHVGRYGIVSHRLVPRLRTGRRLWLGQATWRDRRALEVLAARLNDIVAAPAAQGGRGPLGDFTVASDGQVMDNPN